MIILITHLILGFGSGIIGGLIISLILFSIKDIKFVKEYWMWFVMVLFVGLFLVLSAILSHIIL